ncbi:SDR family NAD(P)-dependent oxidoreductase [Croceicoccus mobilis]|uniref:SDR family NAD(P)-dependent oxidoreductase n=1 Tax=Croceicoccus mobilis TaxID=1703339 RepID=UPI00082E01C5|nr:glucose 1-dehydrogenase [Croceicoccus mobilis]
MEPWFEGKVVAVTGAGDGIGRAVSLLFARRAAKVVVSDIDPAAAEATARAIRGEGGTAESLRVDVTVDDDVAALVACARDSFGGLDCAFNNAGIVIPDDNLWTEEGSAKLLDVNLHGVMRCIRHEVPALLERGGGSIVNTASLAGFIASRTGPQPAYTASKHAVIGLTKTAALQYARQNIRVNALCPGTTRTPMVEAVASQSDEIRSMLENHSPMGRMATPEEMAEAAIWLASDKASYVNGHALVVDGGALAE